MTEDGLLWEWGERHGTRLYCTNWMEPRPVLSKAYGGGNIRDIAFGWTHTLILKKEGTAWFINNYLSSDKPERILPDVQEIAAGYQYFAVLKKDGTVWAWRRNKFLDDEAIKTPEPRQMIFPK